MVEGLFQFSRYRVDRYVYGYYILAQRKNEIVARWVGVRSIPVKWQIASLNASKSEIATETITLRHTQLIRNK